MVWICWTNHNNLSLNVFMLYYQLARGCIANFNIFLRIHCADPMAAGKLSA